MRAPYTVAEQFEKDGFVLIKQAIDSGCLAELKQVLEKLLSPARQPSAGLRQLLRLSPAISRFAETVGRELIANNFGETARPVRGILFDKSVEANWYVTWHQDRTIPVTERKNVQGFHAWSVKDGIQHVQPPSAVLEAMIAMRIHLDDCGEQNGAIKFAPGSHKRGIIPEEDIAREDHNAASVTVAAQAGDIIFMRPLILHASAKAVRPNNRRVIHIEYATRALPEGLEWGLA